MQDPISKRYDSYQVPAINALVRDFSNNVNGRYLLSIPTGGGKTRTAIRALIALFENGVLDRSSDRVLWVAHRHELLNQAKSALEDLGSVSIIKSDANILFETVRMAPKLGPDSPVRLVVIDEAHHAAASSYQRFFAYEKVGVLGLTATPSRYDGEPLSFDRESYSIGFPELVRKRVILKPRKISVNGGEFTDITSIDNTASLELLNNDERNKRIIQCIETNSDIFVKVVVYVGTINHVHDLYQQMLNSSLVNIYDSISFITGDGNSRGISQEIFLEHERNQSRSIIVNVDILTEGYDDPSINTAVMARPTRSKLYYMQAMGRAIRLDSNNPFKNAYVVEVETRLPNISYQIDNRWLYSEISDQLEPQVIDVPYSSNDDLVCVISDVFKDSRFNVPLEWRYDVIPHDHDRYSLILLKMYQAGGFQSLPLLLDKDTRQNITRLFNYISSQIEKFERRGYGAEEIKRIVSQKFDQILLTEEQLRILVDSARNALSHTTVEQRTQLIADGHPWITYVEFVFHETDSNLPKELLDFVDGMINHDQIMSEISSRDYELGDWILRLPFPLSGTFGKIVTAEEMMMIDVIVGQLRLIKDIEPNLDQVTEVTTVLQSAILPIETGYLNSLVTICRENMLYSYELTSDTTQKDILENDQ